jgi:hypothetical protein
MNGAAGPVAYSSINITKSQEPAAGFKERSGKRHRASALTSPALPKARDPHTQYCDLESAPEKIYANF